MNQKYCDYIERNYYKLRDSLMRASGKDFSEDVYHCTLILCDKHFDKSIIDTDIEFDNYLYIAFKNNIIREKKYARNMYVDYTIDLDTLDEMFTVEDSFSSDIDANFIDVDLRNTFGDCMTELYYKWVVDECSIRILEKESGYRTLNYKLNKIKKYVVCKFKEV